MYVIGYEFFENVRHSCVEQYFVDECDDVNCIKSLLKVYCNESCSVGWSFLVEAIYDWVLDRMKCSGGCRPPTLCS